MLQYKTKLEKNEKVQKTQNAGSPLGGKSLLEVNLFIIKGYKYQQINWKKAAWFLYRTNPRAYKVQQ